MAPLGRKASGSSSSAGAVAEPFPLIFSGLSSPDTDD